MVAPFGQNPSRQYSILPILNIVSSQSQSTAHSKMLNGCWQEMQKHQPFGWIKGKEGEHHSLITSIIADEEEVYINGISGFVLDEIMEHYTFADGLPFGVKVEE